jgi:hypothetical protein
VMEGSGLDLSILIGRKNLKQQTYLWWSCREDTPG